MPAEGCVSTDAVSSQTSLVCNCEKATHDGSIWGTGISSEFGSRAAKPLHERCGVSAVSDGLVCPQIHTDPHRLETLAKPGRGNVLVARDSPQHREGQRPHCSRFASAPGGAASPLPAIRHRTGNEDVSPPWFCKGHLLKMALRNISVRLLQPSSSSFETKCA